MTATHALLVSLALASCTKSKPDPRDTQPAPTPPPAVAPAPTPSPAPAPAPPPPSTKPLSSDELVEISIDHDKDINATELGSSLEAYLIERTGMSTESDADYAELQLVLRSPTITTIAYVGGFHWAADPSPTFGSVKALPALSPPRPYKAKDGFEGAPRFRSKAPVVFRRTIRTFGGDDWTYLITHEGDSLVVWSAANYFEDGPSTTWDKLRTIELAAGATISTPTMRTPAPTFDAAASMKVRERLVDTGDNDTVGFDLVIGKQRGSIGQCSVSEEFELVFRGEPEWPVRPLASPPPVTGTIVATRICADSYRQVQNFAVEPRGDDVVVWRRNDDKDGNQGDWLESSVKLR
jgi:hypothetical protein